MAYDRNMENHKFYTSKAWQKKRLEILKRDKHLCKMCQRYMVNSEGTHVHHIVELEDDKSLALVNSNLITLCSSCHTRFHKMENFKWKNPNKNNFQK